MLRLWHRVGIFRVLSVAVLALGLTGGVLVAQRQSPAKLEAKSDSVAKRGGTDDVRQLAQDLSDHQDAQSKANEFAAVDAQRAKAAEDQTRKNEAASRSSARPSPTKPGVNAGPVPASCAEYAGNRATGCTLLLNKGFSLDQMPCLDKLWTKESKWNEKARNPSSGAYGIPQAVPGNKMASFGDDWQTNPATQIAWGLSYIKERYTSPCGAWSHSQSLGWY